MVKIGRLIASFAFFAVSLLCFSTIYKVMTGIYEFNQILIFVSTMVGVVCLYFAIHFAYNSIKLKN